jgi:RNA recognition motif-containing protein
MNIRMTFFFSEHCSHLRAFERSFSNLSTQITEILQESRKEKNDFKLTRILKKNNTEFSLFMRQRNQETNLIEIVISLKKKKRKRKKNKMIKSIMIESIDSKIYMIEVVLFHLLIKQKKTEKFALFSREIDA